jgi:pseudouridine synthase
MTTQRISKYLAYCGIASRRKSEAFVLSGRVTVNGELVTELSFKVSPGDDVRLDGKSLDHSGEFIYIMLNKPRGYLTTASDDRGRATVMSLINPGKHRVFPVGRLDLDSEGLLLLTDDGDLAYKLTHPGRSIDKVYLASLKNPIKEDFLEILRIGIMLDGVKTSPARVRNVHPSGLIIEVTIHEGRKRQIRRMVEAAGSRVLSLKRTKLGPLVLGNLTPGDWRYISDKELKVLKQLGDLPSESVEDGVRDDQEQ